MTPLFTEKQKFTQWWLWVLLLGVASIPAYGIYVQIIQGIPFGDKPASDTVLIVLMLLMLALIMLFWKIELRTTVDREAIRVHYFPFMTKDIKWDEVEYAEVVDYGFVGGWGVRIGTKYGIVYNTKGKMGLALKLKNGKKLCIGTQKPDELRKTLIQLISDN